MSVLSIAKLALGFKTRSADPFKDESVPVNLDASKNLFGSIARSLNGIIGNQDFIPIDGKGGTLDLTGSVNPQWLGLSSKSMQFMAYSVCSPLAGVIDKLAEADTNGILKLVNLDGSDRKSLTSAETRILKLVNNPNPLQTKEEFNSQQVVLCKIFGYCPVYCITPLGMDKSYTKWMFNLNPVFAQPTQNTNFDLMDESKCNPILSWTISIFGKNYAIPSESIILVKDGLIDSNVQNMGLPISKVAGLDYFVSNICAAMEADNVLLKKKGPLGVFSHDPKPDVGGWMPMQQSEKDDLQSELSRYGLTLGQLQYVISKQPLKWNAMSFNLRDLMTKETVRQAVDGICDRFGFPAELMSGKNATYENRDSAEKYLYQNNIVPFSLRRMARYNKYFELTNSKFVQDYNHLAVLQDDIMKAGQARNYRSQSAQIDWDANLITWNERRVLMNMDTVSGNDIYKIEYNKKFGIDETVTPPSSTAKVSGKTD